jgi:hypothetical protein
MKLSKMMILGLSLIALGIICNFIQSTYYGHVDSEGVLHDSLFLPLSFIFGFIGALLCSYSAIRSFFTKK